MIESFDSVLYIPSECVHTGADTIPFVYTRNGTRQVIIPGKSNEKEIIVEKGLKPGMKIYLTDPSDGSKFKLTGENLIKEARARRVK
jgi:hypothetical protein